MAQKLSKIISAIIIQVLAIPVVLLYVIFEKIKNAIKE